MRDIDNLNNLNNFNTKNYQKHVSETSQVSSDLNEGGSIVDSQKEINDLSALPSATFGKAMVTSDNTDADMAFLLKNPTQVAQLNMVFDKYLENHSYEDATRLIDAYKKEFIN